MNRNIPLVQDNSVNSINTSLCAINRAIGQNGVPEVNVNVNYNVTDEVSADNIYPVTSRGVKAALDDLDVSSVGGDGKYISTISETDGKINATETTMDLTPTDNSSKAVTSGGIKTAIDKVKDIMSSLPTDAVLHYSFDEVPDYPDGTAVYFKNKDWTVSDNWNVQTNNATYSVDNGVAVWALTNNGRLDLQKNISNIAGKILKIKFRFSASGKEFRVNGKVGTNFVILATYITNGDWQEATLLLRSDITTELILSVVNDEINSKLEISSIYIGDGSYSTPIIDNANGQNNATNNGGIAVQGVSGKGIYFLNGNENATIPTSAFLAPTSNDNFTISLWLNISTDYIANSRSIKPIIEVGSYAGTVGFVRQANNIILYNRDSISDKSYSTPMDKGKWHNYVGVYNGTEHRFYLYVDGVYIGRTNANTAGFQFGSNSTQWRIWGNVTIGGDSVDEINQPATLDDVLIFDRALTDDEVMALYLNKANTPKYYSWADWKLHQMENVNRSINAAVIEEENER